MDISLWVQSLGQKAPSRFRCRRRDGQYEVSGLTAIRQALLAVNPAEMDRALNAWSAQFGRIDESLATDGKSLCNAIS